MEPIAQDKVPATARPEAWRRPPASWKPQRGGSLQRGAIGPSLTTGDDLFHVWKGIQKAAVVVVHGPSI